MKYFIIITASILFNINNAFAQTINWKSIQNEKKNRVYLNIGYDFSLSTKIGYAYHLKSKLPIILSSDISVPMGNSIFDDYKVRLGGKVLLFEKNDFNLSADIHAVNKRLKNNLVIQNGFGSEISVTFGFYKPKWHLAFDTGYDATNIMKIKNSEIMENIYSEINNGWFRNTAGYLFYGIQGSKKLSKSIEINLKLGATNAKSDNIDALLPVYFNLGFANQF